MAKKGMDVEKEIDELKALEKQPLDMPPGDAAKKPANPNPHLRLGLALIVIGTVALAIVLSGASVWHFWWLIFLIKPLMFGWGWAGRSGQSTWFACDAKSKSAG